MADMICGNCGQYGIRWMGRLSNLTHTECPHCGGVDCQVVEEDDQADDEVDAVTIDLSPAMYRWLRSANLFGRLPIIDKAGRAISARTIRACEWRGLTVEKNGRRYISAKGKKAVGSHMWRAIAARVRGMRPCQKAEEADG